MLKVGKTSSFKRIPPKQAYIQLYICPETAKRYIFTDAPLMKFIYRILMGKGVLIQMRLASGEVRSNVIPKRQEGRVQICTYTATVNSDVRIRICIPYMIINKMGKALFKRVPLR